MCLVFISGALFFAVTAQGLPLDCLTLEARALTRSCGTIIIRETVLGRRLPPGQCTDSTLKHTHSISMKEVYLLLLEQQAERQASGLAHIQRIWRCSQGT